MNATENHIRNHVLVRALAFGCSLIVCFLANFTDAMLFAQVDKAKQEKKDDSKTLKELEKEGDPDALFKRYRQITRRLDRQLKDLKLERKLVQFELKIQLLQVAENFSKLKDGEPERKDRESESKDGESKLKHRKVAGEEIERAYLEVLKLDLDDGTATEYFREKGTLDETVAKLKQQGFPKEPFGKDVRDRQLGLPPQPISDRNKKVKLKKPSAAGGQAKDKEKSKKPKEAEKKEQSDVKSKDKKSKKEGTAEKKKSTGAKKKDRKRKYSPITVKQVLLHHERQFKAIGFQEKNTQKKKNQIQSKWIGKLKEQIKSGILNDDDVEKAYRQIVRRNVSTTMRQLFTLASLFVLLKRGPGMCQRQ